MSRKLILEGLCVEFSRNYRMFFGILQPWLVEPRYDLKSGKYWLFRFRSIFSHCIIKCGPWPSYACAASPRFCSWFIPMAWPISWTMIPTSCISLHQPRLMLLRSGLPALRCCKFGALRRIFLLWKNNQNKKTFVQFLQHVKIFITFATGSFL